MALSCTDHPIGLCSAFLEIKTRFLALVIKYHYASSSLLCANINISADYSIIRLWKRHEEGATVVLRCITYIHRNWLVHTAFLSVEIIFVGACTRFFTSMNTFPFHISLLVHKSVCITRTELIFCKIMRYKMVYITQFKVGKNSKPDFLGINLLTN